MKPRRLQPLRRWAPLALLLPVAALADCTVSTTGVGFGAYDPFAVADTESTGGVEVTCSNLLGVNISYEIALSTGSSGTFSTREMTSGSAILQYQLYTDSARTTVWGDGSGSTATITDGYLLQLLSRTETYPVYGSLFAGQTSAAGSYVDSITVTLTY